MASEYLKWKYRDVKPEEQEELTPAEKRKNWWHYHKWHVVFGAVLVAMAASLIWEVLGIGKVEPDYQIAYVGTGSLPSDTEAALEAEIAALGTDQDGDGVVTVRVNQYPLYSEDPQVVMAFQVQLLADLSECQSSIFLLEDPEKFQRDFQVLCYLDGSLPEEGDTSAEGKCLAWEQCPVLAGMDLGDYTLDLLGDAVAGSSNDLVSKLSLARRGFWSEESCRYPEGCEALWAALTQGAQR